MEEKKEVVLTKSPGNTDLMNVGRLITGLFIILCFGNVWTGCIAEPRYAGVPKSEWNKLLDDRDPQTRIKAINRLGEMGAGAKDFEDRLLEFVNNRKERTDVRVAAIYSLIHIGKSTGTLYPDIMSLSFPSDDENPAIQAAAASWLDKDK